MKKVIILLQMSTHSVDVCATYVESLYREGNEVRRRP